ncbi:DUF3619 family protein [Herbaspirillum sp. RTI4]|uniref:DUF3619 family protein n=1 Tax=Herbaspirillum sp. RTI4 TaxID=3048640 RepID=UPI002AB3AC8C|nr:DUF3619 family protein [Herbaspirillum sp. RTI4]MDY7578452.1 DUF3619 family protein [Herbaspirillum sp. RTI4]MEA9982534.1 DUF3619 family protein [Herbaspirillum sp. RTI4]
MKNQQIQFAYRVRHALDANLDNLPTSVTERLASSRKIAISKKRADSPVRVVAVQMQANALGSGTMGSFQSQYFDLFSWMKRFGVAAPLLAGILLFVGLYEHEHQQRIAALAEIDTGVLTDELPLSAYLDHGFSAYLSKQAE